MALRWPAKAGRQLARMQAEAGRQAGRQTSTSLCIWRVTYICAGACVGVAEWEFWVTSSSMWAPP